MVSFKVSDCIEKFEVIKRLQSIVYWACSSNGVWSGLKVLILMSKGDSQYCAQESADAECHSVT